MPDLPPAPPVSFAEFAPLPAAQWQAQLTRELRGTDPARLRWTLPGGVELAPYYDQSAYAALGGPPAPRPPRPAPCRNVVALPVPAGTDGRLQIEQGVDALARGAGGLHFQLSGDPAAFALPALAARLPLAATWLGFTVAQQPEALLTGLRELAAGQLLQGWLRFTPALVPEGAELHPFRDTLRRCLALTRDWPAFRPLTVNGLHFGNKGGTLPQQMAYALSTGAALLAELPTPDGPTVAEVAHALHLDVAVGTSFFAEIARLRAGRQLWATLFTAFGLPPETALALPIHAATSTWLQTTLDPHTNLLRHTTEAMSAVLGGADSVQVAPFDCLYQAPHEFSARLARNLPVLLHDEAHLGWVADPGAGSYFLETLTDELARAAWLEFQAVEALGGLGSHQARARALEAVSQAGMDKFKRLATGADVLVGTNRFQNPQEKFDYNPKQLLRSREFDTTRAAYPSEVLRLATALHFERRANKDKQAALVLLGGRQVNQDIADAFWQQLHPGETRPPAGADIPADSYSVLFSQPDEATLMYARPGQFEQLARVVQQVPSGHVFDIPSLINSDLATLLEAVRVFGFHEFSVEGHKTEEVLARLQGR